MKRLHLINLTLEDSYKKMGITKIKGEKNKYYSCCWKFKYDEAKELIGGNVYFHSTKKELSFFGGKVLDVQPMKINGIPTEFYCPLEGDENKSQDRVYFTIEATKEHKGQVWKGRDNTRDWTSGIIDEGDV